MRDDHNETLTFGRQAVRIADINWNYAIGQGQKNCSAIKGKNEHVENHQLAGTEKF